MSRIGVGVKGRVGEGYEFGKSSKYRWNKDENNKSKFTMVNSCVHAKLYMLNCTNYTAQNLHKSYAYMLNCTNYTAKNLHKSYGRKLYVWRVGRAFQQVY